MNQSPLKFLPPHTQGEKKHLDCFKLSLNFLVWHFFHLHPKPRTYFHVCLLDGTAMIFPTSDAATRNQTHISSLAPPRGTFIQNALLTELVRSLPHCVTWCSPKVPDAQKGWCGTRKNGFFCQTSKFGCWSTSEMAWAQKFSRSLSPGDGQPLTLCPTALPSKLSPNRSLFSSY